MPVGELRGWEAYCLCVRHQVVPCASKFDGVGGCQRFCLSGLLFLIVRFFLYDRVVVLLDF